MPEVTSPQSSQNAVLAFFDVDNTLMRGASVYYLAKEAWHRGIVGWRDIARFTWQQFRFISVGENHKHMASARERALAIVGGHSEKTLFELAEQIYERDILPNLWPETVDLAECWAYSDSRNDIPLLTAVGNRVAVNADAKLTNHAQKLGWQILPLNRASLKEASRRV